jgi:hypothetical protein
VHVDIFSYWLCTEPDGSRRYRVEDVRFAGEDPDSPQAHCNTSYTPAELMPLQAWPFYDLTLAVPAQAGAALCRALGPDYMRVMRARVGGAAGGAAAGVRAIALEDFSPA